MPIWATPAGECPRVADVPLAGAHGAGHELERRLDLHALGGRRQELGRGDDRAHDLPDVAAGALEHRGGALHHRRGRLVRDEPARELVGDPARGGGMRGQEMKHLIALLPASRPYAAAEHRLLAALVQPRPEQRTAGRPARGGVIVQPVKQRATSVTSFWV